MDFTLQYYTPYRGIIPTPTLAVSLALEDLLPLRSGLPVEVSGLVRKEIYGRVSFALEFETVQGKAYSVQYTDSLLNEWRTAQPEIIAPASRLQWIDYGPPATECAPAEAATRFYRVIEVSP
jgi:hypothetical protein